MWGNILRQGGGPGMCQGGEKHPEEQLQPGGAWGERRQEPAHSSQHLATFSPPVGATRPFVRLEVISSLPVAFNFAQVHRHQGAQRGPGWSPLGAIALQGGMQDPVPASLSP